MTEPVDAIPHSSNIREVPISSLSLGKRQAVLGKAWADIYSDPSKPPTSSAEIVLRNPAVFLRDVDKVKLPEDIRGKWKELSAFADSLAQIAATNPVEWGSVNGLDKLQQLVFTGNVKPDFRRSIGDVMKVSSDLFAESVDVSPGDQRYFAGNVVGAESWLARASQPQTV